MMDLDGCSLTLEDVVAAAEGLERVRIAPSALLRMQASRRRVDAATNGATPVYALNTGVGLLANIRLDETEIGAGTTITLINPARPTGFRETNDAGNLAKQLGLKPWATSASWDIFDAVLTPGDLILLMSWKDDSVARTYEGALAPNDKARIRRVRQIRIVRDYGKYDRREAPQYYADAKGAKTVHASRL